MSSDTRAINSAALYLIYSTKTRASERFAYRIIINLSAVSVTRNQRRSFRERGANESTTAKSFRGLECDSSPPSRRVVCTAARYAFASGSASCK